MLLTLVKICLHIFLVMSPDYIQILKSGLITYFHCNTPVTITLLVFTSMCGHLQVDNKDVLALHSKVVISLKKQTQHWYDYTQTHLKTGIIILANRLASCTSGQKLGVDCPAVKTQRLPLPCRKPYVFLANLFTNIIILVFKLYVFCVNSYPCYVFVF